MEYRKHINIRITEDQFKRLKSTIAKENMTMSEIVRSILLQYTKDNLGSNSSKVQKGSVK